jgi:hypothetical protein
MADGPKPHRMSVDTAEWMRRLDLSNFVNAYYEYRDIADLPDCKRVLVVGPGQGLGVQVLRWRGYEVVTFDIDETFRPDHVGSVHDLSRFRDKEFDAILASHVLEHLPLPYLDISLAEIARVAHYAIIYLPVHGRHVQFRLIPGFKDLDLSLVLDLFNVLEKPDGLQPRYMSGQHYWEVGMRGFRVSELKDRFSHNFAVLRAYRNRDWLPSQNFVLESRKETHTR